MVRTLDRDRLASLWQDTAFNDVILVVEGPQTTMKIPAHKAVLAAASPFFHKMFTSASFIEKNKPEILFKLDYIRLDPGSVEAILRYIYRCVFRSPSARTMSSLCWRPPLILRSPSS